MIHRRTLLRGLFATPAIVAASSLMPLRGTKMLWDGSNEIQIFPSFALCKGDLLFIYGHPGGPWKQIEWGDIAPFTIQGGLR